MQSDHLEVTCDAHDCTNNVKVGGVGLCAGYKIHIRTTRGFRTCTNYKRHSPAMKGFTRSKEGTDAKSNIALTPEQFAIEANDVFDRVWYGR